MATKRQRRKRRRRAEGAIAGGDAIATGTGSSEVESDDAAPARPAAARGAKGPPPAPWGSFPLTELVVLVALVMLVAGFVVSPPRGAVLLGAGLVLGSLAGLELAVREHFAGYKSHTMLLAGALGMAVVAGLYFLGPDSLKLWVCLAAGVAAFAAATWLFSGAFRRRSGGALFKFRS